ncbi:ThiF family adenylyltransferase [Actinoplanes sp. NPDC049118]|uniref:HesA/MoeB/ThiF family protein n=1 Tax=Actinoplanes sp. NPDC049118 TaxID=3155769 RepID=UPI0033E38070
MTEPRYARHALIPDWDQDLLKAARVVVIGVGALGGEVARLLALAGVGRLTLVDPDVVDESNLSRCTLFRAADVGRSKVDTAAAALADLAPDTLVDPRPAPLTAGAGRAELRDATLVVSALDSVAARVELATRCNSVGAGLLDAGTRPWGGEVRHYRCAGACYACPLTPGERAVRDDPRGCGQFAAPVEAGASGAVSSLVGAWQGALALRLLFGLEVAGLTRIDVTAGASAGPGPRRAADCPCHDDIPAAAVTAVPLTVRATVAETLALVGAGEDVMAWAAFARDGSAAAGTPRARTFLRSADPGRSLAELGVAPGEILPIRAVPGGAVRYIELSTTSEEPRR